MYRNDTAPPQPRLISISSTKFINTAIRFFNLIVMSTFRRYLMPEVLMVSITLDCDIRYTAIGMIIRITVAAIALPFGQCLPR